MENLRRVEREAAARREAEEQLEFLIDSSPVAILAMTVAAPSSRQIPRRNNCSGGGGYTGRTSTASSRP